MAEGKAKKLRRSIRGSVSTRKMNKTRNIHYFILGLLSLILYANTLPHDYALDDSFVIIQNSFTQKGLEGIPQILVSDQFAGKYGFQKNIVIGGRYRPLSIVSFAIEYQFFGENPHLSHFFNILFYFLTALIIYRIFTLLLHQRKFKEWYTHIPFLTALLFLVHPLHTEAVANIKGRDEIFVLLFSLLALYYQIRYFISEKKNYLWYSAIMLFLGLLSKENAITFLAIIPFTLYVFYDRPVKEILKATIPLLISGAVFLVIRQLVLGWPGQGDIDPELMNQPFMEMNFAQRYATIFLTLIIYLKLLVFPHPLTFDYYPYHIPITEWSNPWSILSLLFYLGLGIFVLLRIRRKNYFAWAALFYLASLSIVSNVFFSIGAFMSERFIYISSLAFCFTLAYLISDYLAPAIKNSKSKAFILSGIIIVIGISASAKTIVRNKAWKDNYTLFSTDVKTSKNSAKCHVALGEAIYHKGEDVKDLEKRKEILRDAISHFRRAIEIHPRYANAMLLLGNSYFELDRMVDSTIYYYLKALEVKPLMRDVYLNIEVVANALPDVDRRIEFFEKINSYYSENYKINYLLGTWYGKDKHNYEKAILYLEKACKIKPSSFDAFNNLGLVYGFTGNYKKALNAFQTAYQFDRSNKQVITNIGVTYQNLGDTASAGRYFGILQQMN